MTDPHLDPEAADSAATRPVSVAELLARNGTIGSPPVTGRRRRRRGNSDEVTVAELTGEIPVIRDDDHGESPAPHAHRANGRGQAAVPDPDQLEAGSGPAEPVAAMNWAEAGPRWPESPPQPLRDSGPELSHYPRPARKADGSDAEQMSPDPIEAYADAEVDVMDTEVRAPELPAEDAEESAQVRSALRRALFGRARRRSVPDDGPAGPATDVVAEQEPAADLDHEPAGAGGDDAAGLTEVAELSEVDGALAGTESAAAEQAPGRIGVLRGLLVVLQSVLAVAFGAGLFVGFEVLWKWNAIVALALSVLVILGLVVAVRVVRKTEDIGSTLSAVVVGAVITIGPLALLQSSG